MLSQSPQRNRRLYSRIPGQPDDSPPRSLRGSRSGSMAQNLSDIPHSQHGSTQSLSNSSSYPPQKRSPPVAISATQPQHVSAPNSQAFSSAQYLPDQNVNHAQAQVQTQPQHTPPLNFPRPVQRVPPPPLLPSDSRFNNEWIMTDQLLAEINRATHDPEAANIAGIGSGSGSGSQPSAQLPMGPMTERERDRDRARDRTDSPKDGEFGGSGGSAGSGTGRSGSLRIPTRTAPHGTPPHTPPHTHAAAGQSQRPLPVVPGRPSEARRDSSSRLNERDRGSPTYYSTLASPPTGSPHHGQTHSRVDSPPFQFDDHLQAGVVPSKAKTPDRSLPVREENEGEEDVTITPALALEREQERQRERDRQRDREVEIELEREREKARELSRQIDHRLPAQQFSSSPLISPDHIRVGESMSDVELSSTVQGDEYNDDHGHYDHHHDGRSSRATHRFDEDEQHQHRHAESQAVDQDAEDQDDTESYTPRSHHASLPPQNALRNGGPSNERFVYNAAMNLNFRPRTASSDGGRMGNLDAAVLQNAIENPYIHDHGAPRPTDRSQPGQQSFNTHSSSYGAAHSHGQHTAYPTRVPTADEIRALVGDHRAYDPWQAAAMHHIRPGAPVPPTPPNAATLPSLSHTGQSFSPAPPRSTPYPYSYQYQHVVHRSQDSQQLLQHLHQQQLQQLQLLAASGVQSDSTFSPSATPYPTYDYSPFLADHFRRQNGIEDPSMSMRSSPSHMPVSLPLFTANRRNVVKRNSLRRVRGIRELVTKLPPRGESTEPRETSPESSDGEEVVDGEEEFDHLAARLEASGSSESATAQQGPSEDGGEWVDEDEDTEDDLLHLEYHPNFVVNTEKRRKRWELKWDALMKAFQALDRQTDSTLLLLASPTHGKSLYSVRSRSLRRIPSLANSPQLAQIKAAFVTLSSQRKAARSQTRHMSLAERLEQYSSSSPSDGGESREEELKGALGAALSSLSALSNIYEGREQRWRTEMGRMGDERERVEVLLRQALGMGFGPGVF